MPCLVPIMVNNRNHGCILSSKWNGWLLSLVINLLHVLVIPKFGGAKDLEKVAVDWAAMSTLSKQCNTILNQKEINVCKHTIKCITNHKTFLYYFVILMKFYNLKSLKWSCQILKKSGTSH